MVNEPIYTHPQDVDTDFYAFVDSSYNKTTDLVGAAVILVDAKTGEKSIIDADFENSNVDNMRNVGGEVIAADMAIRAASSQNAKSLTIFYDYQGIEFWATGKWKANKNTTQGYASFVKEFSKKLKIKFVKVPAHTGVPLNEEVDKIAKQSVGIV